MINSIQKVGVNMSESKLRDMSMDFSVDIINLVKHLKSKHETVYPLHNAESVIGNAHNSKMNSKNL